MDELIKRYNSIFEGNINKIYGICANKIDLIESEDKYLEEKAQQFSLKNNFDYYGRTSCATYEGIEDMFYNLIDKYLTKNKDVLKTKIEEEKLEKKIKKEKIKIAVYSKNEIKY